MFSLHVRYSENTSVKHNVINMFQIDELSVNKCDKIRARKFLNIPKSLFSNFNVNI